LSEHPEPLVLDQQQLRPLSGSPAYLSSDVARRLRLRERKIADRLPYDRHLDNMTLRTRSGLLIQCIKVEGFAFETADDDELGYRKTQRETLFKSLATSRLAIYHHVLRRRVDVELASPPDDPFCAGLDHGWREMLASRQLYVNELFLTLVRRPLAGRIGVLDRFLRRADSGESVAEELSQLHSAREALVAALAPYNPRTLSRYTTPQGTYSECAEFLSALATGEFRSIQEPVGELGEVLADRRLSFGFKALEIDAAGEAPRRFGAIVSIKDYPARSAPGMLDGVLRLPYQMVLSESFSFVDQQSTLDRMGLALRRLRAAEDDAFSLRQDLTLAKDDVGAGRAAYGEHHLSILVLVDTFEALDRAVAEVRSSLTSIGLIGVREDINLEPAFWAQFPGNFGHILRKALISTANFASFATLHNYHSGSPEGNHWGSAITTFETTASGPYHFNFHNGDLGNFTVIGPSGAGKTVLLGFLIAQARRLRPRVVYFDKDRGAEIFIRAIGGRYDVLRPGQPSGLNPLHLPDTPENRAFLVQWLERLVAAPTTPLEPEERALIVDAIDANFSERLEHRRLRHIRALLTGAQRPREGDLASRLRAWCDGGEHAWLFDNDCDRIDPRTEVLGFDMTGLLDTPALRTPTMMYLFHRIEQLLDGNPAIIVIDEGWKALDDEIFVQKIKDWEKTIRKKNGILGFCTQNASDALESRIATSIIEQSATQIFLPNPKARPVDYIEGFGLTAHELDLVRTLPDYARCFLVKQTDHSAVVRLDLGSLPELRVLAGNERSVRRLDRLRERLGDAPSEWLEPFLAEAGERRP
jgi:type IV secretion system protein VirB4